MNASALAEAVRAIAREDRVVYPEPTGDAMAAIVDDARAGLGRRALMVKHNIGREHASQIVERVRPMPRDPDLFSF
jgi:hypothetical protein